MIISKPQPNTTEYKDAYTSPLSLVGGASRAGFSNSSGGLLGPRIDAPSFPRSGLGTDAGLSGPHIGKLGLVLAYGTVAVGSAAEELIDGGETREDEELMELEGEVGAPSARVTRATRRAALRMGDIAS